MFLAVADLWTCCSMEVLQVLWETLLELITSFGRTTGMRRAKIPGK